MHVAKIYVNRLVQAVPPSPGIKRDFPGLGTSVPSSHSLHPSFKRVGKLDVMKGGMPHVGTALCGGISANEWMGTMIPIGTHRDDGHLFSR